MKRIYNKIMVFILTIVNLPFYLVGFPIIGASYICMNITNYINKIKEKFE